MKNARPQLLALCTFVVALLCGVGGDLQNALSDLRFGWLSRAASGDIVVVAIDPRSLDAIGVWPWPRTVHADLIRRLNAAKAGDIAFDVDFSSRSTTQGDTEFAKALSEFGNSVVLAEFIQADGGQPSVHLNAPLTEFSANAWPATVNVTPEPNGVVRKYRSGDYLGHSFEPSLAAVLAHRADIARRPFFIDYGIRPDTIPTVSYIDVLRNVPEAVERVVGKTVIVGGTAVELGDRFNVPVYGLLPGPLVQALAAETLLQHRDLYPSSPLVVAAGLCLLILVMALIWRASATVRAALLLSFAVIAEIGAAIVQAKFPITMDTAYFHLAIASYLIAIVLDEIDIRGLIGRIAERRFEKFTTSIGDGVVCADNQNRITVWNPGATRIFGYEMKEAIGRPIDMLWHPEVSGDAFSISCLSPEDLRQPGGKTVEFQGYRNNEEPFPIEASFSVWDTPDGPHLGTIIRDISDRKREEARIRYLAEHDTLTGLLNRDALYSKANAYISGSAGGQSEVALMITAVTNFHQINDMFGHACGDEVLCSIARRLSSLVHEGCLVARLDGDEFAILVSGYAAGSCADLIASRVVTSLGGVPLLAAHRQHRIVPSVGLAIYPHHCDTADELLGCAHLALDRARTGGGANQVLFSRAIREEIQARLAVEAELRSALAEDQFELFYQPQVDISDTSIIGAEALIRWRHPERGLVLPGEFMPIVNGSVLSDS